MQSPTASTTGPNLATIPTTEKPLETETEAQPEQSEPGAPEEESTSASATETETPVTPQGNGTRAEAPARMAVTHGLENQAAAQLLSELSDNTGGKESKPSAPTQPGPDTNTNPGCDGQKEKKRDKGVRDGRKYVPSKKAMVDPLKMDMSKPLVMPLTSSQLSLQCIECHIIFSDDKSKVRHLKLSHPAEYEQCILRNALFACYVCDRHFTNSTELMAHQKAHVERKPFKCPICSQAFKKSSELTLHKKIHFGLDGYACTDCGKPCKTMTLLKYHRRTHTGERPYVCKECGMRFTMSKALQKHILSHLPEGEREGEGEGCVVKAQHKKDDGASTKYPCSLCKATFKSTRTRLHHMKTKHKVLPAAASDVVAAGHQVKQSTPIITPISFCQPSLLQVEPNGPLQKVDANIDTEQIRRLIESLGNVQKVNQVVILGQVPPHAPPLEVQQISQQAEPENLNLNPPQIDLVGLKQNESKSLVLDPSNNLCDSMEQTIILEPITPDGQLETPSFSEMGSHIATGGNIELTLVPTEQTMRPDGEVMHHILQQPDISAIQSSTMDQMICQNEVDMFKQNLEQTVILELTPALIPTVELEQSQSMAQNEILSSSLVPATELEKLPDQTPDQPVIVEQETSLVVPPLLHAVELELTPLQREQQDRPPYPFVPTETLTQIPCESETNPKEVSQMQTVSVDHAHSVMDEDSSQKTLNESEQKTPEPSEKLLVISKDDQKQAGNQSEVKDPSPNKEVPSQMEKKQVTQTSEIPVNVMSAQELVKVRKRKPARAFIFQGYMQELVGSMYRDDLQIDTQPAKRQRAKKSHLVVKFGPQSKEKNKQKKPSQRHKQTQEDAIREKKTKNIPERNVLLQKKERKGKKDKKGGHLVSIAEIKSRSLTQDPQARQIKEDTRKNKTKKKKEVATGCIAHISEHKTVVSPAFKKKKQAKVMRKDKSKNAKDGKRKKNLARQEKEKANTASTETTGPQTTQDALLLLRGHKQPQLKVYKLDTSKASSQTQETSPQSQQSKGNKPKHPISNSTYNTTAGGKKKGGRPKKNLKGLSLLSSLQVSNQSPETLPTKQKTTRKRKASSKVETEGVITSSHSKRALECKDCGEKFSEVSSLQKHKATVHIIESPGLTYTNGNIFEGVSRLDLYQLPKQCDQLGGVINAATDWDTEPELGEMALEDRERNVSFPTLIPSPSLPAPPANIEISGCEGNGGSRIEAHDQSHATSEVHTPADQMENREIPQKKSCKTSDECRQEKGTLKNARSEAEVQCTKDEDIKEDLLLEVDLVTVGEQNEGHDPNSHEVAAPQNESNGPCSSESGITGHVNETEESLTSHNVSCSTQMEVKEEEDEILVQQKKGNRAVKKNARRGWRRTGHLKRGMIPKTVSDGHTVELTESEKEEQCQIVYEKLPVTSDSEINNDGETGPKNSKPETIPEFVTSKPTVPPTPSPSALSTLEESPEEQVVFELKSVTTSVEEVINERGLQGEEEHDGDKSPGIILERFLTSRQRVTSDQELCPIKETNSQRQGLDSSDENDVQVIGSQEIKVEENVSDPLLVVATFQNRPNTLVQPQHHRDIRTVLVKEESTHLLNEQSSRSIRWNVEPADDENTSSPFTESMETTRDCRVTPEFNTSQCIFYPVKEEEREVLLGAAQTISGNLTTGTSSDALLTEHQATDINLEADAELQHPPDLRDFLLQNSDEEDVAGFELADPQLDSEAEVMAYFYKNQTSNSPQPDEMSHNLQTSASQVQTPREENKRREPIEYFSKYFGWDTWVEIASCTNQLSKIPNPVTEREVAQFIGIHIAMGTLKFPSLKLYWEALTKVPLIAEAMPLSRFLELTRMLKLASNHSINSNSRAGRHDHDFENAQQIKNPSIRHSEMSLHSNRQRQEDIPNDLNLSAVQTDPLWKARPILCRFKAGCQSLRRDDHYAVDQYPLPLTGKIHNKTPSLHCTTLIGFGGFLLHVDFKFNLSGKDDAVEQLVPKGSMVYLCKQELSTPAMLERLLVAGVHGAGRVAGTRGQIGDEFVSSDGKLMLRRSGCGFILSTAGNSQRNTSLIDNFEKAQMSAHLSRDLRNLYSIPLTASAPSCWPQAVLWYLTDLALINSWLLYRQDNRTTSAPLTLMDFRLEVSKALILSSSTDTQDSIPPQPPTEKAHATNDTPNPSLVEESPLPDAATRYDGSGHWPEQLGEGEGGRCRFRDCQRTSRVLCLKCCVFLCISRNHNCFLNFHNQGSLGKQ